MVGGAAGVVWLVLPVMTIKGEVPVAAGRGEPVASASVQGPEPEAARRSSAQDPEDHPGYYSDGGTSPADLVLPLVAVGGVVVLAGYGYVRRTRRARTRTTPGVVSPQPPVTPLPVLERQAGTALVQADDCLRTSREELAFAEDRFGVDAVRPFAGALREAERELSAAFAIRVRYEHGVPAPEEEAARRQALAGIVGRCAEAGRRLDAEAPGFDQLRALERDMGDALGVAEGRFRELAGRTGAVEATLADLDARHPAPGAPATAAVTGYVEQAKDRLVFATTHLNQARQATDLGDTGRAIRDLRAAEGAISQADTFLTGVDRLANSLAEAAQLVPAALTGAEAELARVRAAAPSDLASAHTTLAAVREELTSDAPYDPYNPLDALRRIVRALLPLGAGQDGVLGFAARLVARADISAADGFVGTHRGAVGVDARTRLAEAQRLLDTDTDPATADVLALEARELAEQDVRTHGNPYAGAADEHTSGVGGAVLGGILLGEDPDGGPPLSFGGPDTRKRRGLPPT